jgi:ABC-type glycerol-3-phosphate transport system substrate-binding protein
MRLAPTDTTSTISLKGLFTMRLALLLVSGCALAGCSQASATPAGETRCNHAGTDAERQAVAATVQLYFRGHATGNGEFFRQALHPEAKVMWVKDGALAQRTSAEFAAGAKGSPADDEARRSRKIVMIDIADDAAIAKVELAYPDATFIDYLSLLRVDGKWVVMNKIFHRGAPKAAVPSHG